MSEILRDLEAVRGQRKRAEDREAHFRAQREQLELEEAALVQLVALARLGKNEHPRQGALVFDPEEMSAIAKHSVDAALISNRANAGSDTAVTLIEAKRPSSKRPAILGVMRDHPEHDRWTTREVRGRLLAQGIEASTNLVGVTLRRMVESGELVRDEDDPRFFKLPSARQTTSMGAGRDSKP